MAYVVAVCATATSGATVLVTVAASPGHTESGGEPRTILAVGPVPDSLPPGSAQATLQSLPWACTSGSSPVTPMGEPATRINPGGSPSCIFFMFSG